MGKMFSSTLNEIKDPYLHEITCFELSSSLSKKHRLQIKIKIHQVIPSLHGRLVILIL